MSRKRTGLRHKFRDGSHSTYAARRRTNGADHYGHVINGVIEDIIAGRVLHYRAGDGVTPSGLPKLRIPQPPEQ